MATIEIDAVLRLSYQLEELVSYNPLARDLIDQATDTLRALAEQARACPSWHELPTKFGRWERWLAYSSGGVISSWSYDETIMNPGIEKPSQFIRWYGPLPNSVPPEKVESKR